MIVKLSDMVEGLYDAMTRKLIVHVAVMSNDMLAIEFAPNIPADRIQALMWYVKSRYNITSVDFVQGILLVDGVGLGGMWSGYLRVMRGEVVIGLCCFVALRKMAFTYHYNNESSKT